MTTCRHALRMGLLDQPLARFASRLIEPNAGTLCEPSYWMKKEVPLHLKGASFFDLY